MKNQSDFCVFILTHGRPDNVITFNTLKKAGYSGRVFLVIDNEDSSWQEYVENFGAENVILFDKRETAKRFDEFDNFEDRRAIVYARNECFEIARKLGYKYFLELDDDYSAIGYRSEGLPGTGDYGDWVPVRQTSVKLFEAVVDFLSSSSFFSIAFSQGGDWMCGDKGKEIFNCVWPLRKCMNTFFCSTSKPFNFAGRINEDVNTYTWFQSMGNLFLTIPLIQITQKQTQKNKGGMSDTYLDSGTYFKSFYSIICSPSCVQIKIMGSSNRRMHHRINWDTAVPMIVSEALRKNPRKKPLPAPVRKIGKLMTVSEINSLVAMPEPRAKPALKTAKKSNIKVTKSAAPKKEFDQDYWKNQGFKRDPKADIQL